METKRTKGIKELKAEVCKLAYHFITEKGMNQSEAMQIAWANAVLRNALHHRTNIDFCFMKADGQTRRAFGTLAGVEDFGNVGGETEGYNMNVQRYYDNEKKAWRSFKRENLICVNHYYRLTF